MASSPSASRAPHGPNTAFRRLRGELSPGEFAAAVRRSAREIGEQVSCDARYIGRVEAGEIRCPNYAYERVFRHMFPDCSLADMGFAPRETVRGRAARANRACGGEETPPQTIVRYAEPCTAQSHHSITDCPESHEESDVLRRAFMTGGPAALAAVPFGGPALGAQHASARTHPAAPGRAGEAEAAGVEHAVRQIRLLDDRHGADGLFSRVGDSLRAAYELLDARTHHRSVSERLHNGAGELSISVGWLAHDSGHYLDARSHYAEALATARVAADSALEAHAFCNTAFLARDAGRPREAVRAALAGRTAAEHLGSARLLSLLALREAGGWAGLGDRTACRQALSRAQSLFDRGPSDADPEWMTFFGRAELEGLEAQCWSALGDWERATDHAHRAVELQQPHFVRNKALFTAELANNLAAQRRPEEAAEAGSRALELLGPVRSSRIRHMLVDAAKRLRPYEREHTVAVFLERQAHAHPA